MKLKPCPFCGGKAKMTDGWPEWVYCSSCGAKVHGWGIEESVAAWNRRKIGEDTGGSVMLKILNEMTLGGASERLECEKEREDKKEWEAFLDYVRRENEDKERKIESAISRAGEIAAQAIIETLKNVREVVGEEEDDEEDLLEGDLEDQFEKLMGGDI